MKLLKRGATALGAVALVMGISACSSVDTDSGVIALEYNGGAIIPTDKDFIKCVDSNSQEYEGPGNKFYYYAAGQRNFDATGGDGADSGPIGVVSQDNATLNVPTVVQFDLTADCDKLRAFHERLGVKYHAYMDNGNTTDGWRRLIAQYIGTPVDTTLDRIAQKYPWRKVWNDPAVKVEMEKELSNTLPATIKTVMGDDYFTNFRVQLKTPTPTDANLVNAINAEQAQVAGANAAEAQARARTAAAKAQEAEAKALAAKQQAEISGYPSIDAYLKAKLIEKGGNPFQPSYGGALATVPAPAASPAN